MLGKTKRSVPFVGTGIVKVEKFTRSGVLPSGNRYDAVRRTKSQMLGGRNGRSVETISRAISPTDGKIAVVKTGFKSPRFNVRVVKAKKA